MTREIKFRGRDASGTWFFGDLHQWSNGEVYIGVHSEVWSDDGMNSQSYPSFNEIDPDTVGQYTGLHDKNGKEIYEGDILKWTDEKDRLYEILFCYVDWHKHLCKFYLSFGEEQKVNDTKTDIFEMMRMGYNYEVIGNIHDNQELLKKKRNEI